MIETLYLHIGMHKTGTTSIQESCAHNANSLLESGYVYPLDDSMIWNGHHQIPWALLNSNHQHRNVNFNLTEYVKKLNGEASSKSLILSSENFTFLRHQEISDLAELLPSKNVKIIVYVRNLVDRLRSGYKQHVEQPNIKYTGEISEFYYEKKYDSVLDYLTLIDKWEKIYPGSVQVCSYDMEKKDLVSKFYEKVDASVGHEDILKKSNVSLNDLSIELLRRFGADISSGKRAMLICKLKSLQSQSDNKYSLVTEEDRKSIHEKFGLLISEMKSRYGISVDKSELRDTDSHSIRDEILLERTIGIVKCLM